jgi:hypothetical protein
VEARLEAKIEASMEVASVLVTDTMNARFTEALKVFEGHITRRREEEEVARAQTNPSAKTKQTTPETAAPKPTQSHNCIDLRPEEGDENASKNVATEADKPEASRPQQPAQIEKQPQMAKGKEVKRPMQLTHQDPDNDPDETAQEIMDR